MVWRSIGDEMEHKEGAHCSNAIDIRRLAVQPRMSVFLSLFSLPNQVIVSTNMQGIVSDAGSCRALRSALRLTLYSQEHQRHQECQERKVVSRTHESLSLLLVRQCTDGRTQ